MGLAAGIDPPAVEQQVEVNNLLQSYKSIADNAKTQYEGLRDKLGEQHPVVLQAKNQWERQQQKAADYEAEVRTKVRNLLKDQLEQNVSAARWILTAAERADIDRLSEFSPSPV